MNLFTKVIYYLKRIIYLLFKENFHKKLKFDWVFTQEDRDNK